MPTGQTFVVVGAGQAGGTAIQKLRAEGFDGRIVLVGAESHLPYERPPLSKSYLKNEGWLSHKSLLGQQWYDKQEVEVRLGTRAVALRSDDHQVVLDDDTTLDYDKILIATGSSARRLKAPGAELAGVHYLRTLEDSEALGAALDNAPNVVIVGASWIGLETADAALQKGCRVTVIGPGEAPLEASMGTLLGGYFADVHRSHGVEFELGRRVVGLEGAESVESVVVDDGTKFPADVVIVGVGAVPESGFLEERLLAEDGGIRVDSRMQAEAPDVFAAGDIASVANPLYGRQMRVEHWNNALMEGKIAAHSMLGQSSDFDPAPFFFTDQYDLALEYAGRVDARRADDPVIRGDLAADRFHAFWLVDDVVVAGLHVNAWDEGIEPVQELIRSQARVDPAELANPAVPLTQLVQASRP
ncbi:MAG: NAD(P)/FAD-dependent oxidoreductase [Arthrobacter sp.]|uniref:NAD(P)/FAD-dependent oxidoreductase n=1 Tax=unclassified Arthrobacter TaxID=235627 RepID=UPI002650F5E1|nr:FAD-dependent oxidoreductase [Micrococcaceae bacterium]MDN5878280.1 FAD-dependent oxidoreductase [Micrococcaceae bacterium]MDN5885727.1 FAD-dependent oxidoreductase [Micrococcaceae bacterium]MDN5906175.1 FAD-dependent oxidoreductase [Micrococcaceae bacterium]MDN6168677.1 FAD-dependent oxidoreductase [Micrococcaceae bacterium]